MRDNRNLGGYPSDAHLALEALYNVYVRLPGQEFSQLYASRVDGALAAERLARQAEDEMPGAETKICRC